MRLGRNQQIAIYGYGSTLLVGLGLVVFGGLAAKDWLDSALLAVGSVISLGAAVNAVEAIAGRKSEVPRE